MLQASDLYILIGLAVQGDADWTLRGLAARLHVDHTLVHRALKRAEGAGLYSAADRRVQLPGLEELLVHAARFVAPASLGPIVPGMPAAWAAAPMSRLLRESPGDPPPVWPSAEGRVRGQALEPLHPAAAVAVGEFPELRAALSAVDSLRAGDIRVREVAAGVLRDTMRQRAAQAFAAR